MIPHNILITSIRTDIQRGSWHMDTVHAVDVIDEENYGCYERDNVKIDITKLADEYVQCRYSSSNKRACERKFKRQVQIAMEKYIQELE